MRFRATARRLFTLIAPLFVSTSTPASAADVAVLKLKVAGKEAALKPPALYDGREVYVPLEALRLFGVTYEVNRREEAAAITLAGGVKTEVPLARLAGLKAPLSHLADTLSAEIAVREGICEVRARITGLGWSAGQLSITTGFPLPALIREMGGQAVIEIPGAAPSAARRGTDAAGGEPGIRQERTGEGVRLYVPVPPGRVLAEGSTRAACTLAFRLALPPVQIALTPAAVQKPESPEPSRQPAAAPESKPQKESPAKPAPSVSAPKSDPPKPAAAEEKGREESSRPRPLPQPGVAQEPENVEQPPARPEPPGITGLTVEAAGAGGARLRISATGRISAAARFVPDPERLIVDIPNARLPAEGQNWQMDHLLIVASSVGPGETGDSVRITLVLREAVPFRVLPATPDGISIELGRPARPIRSLSEMTIVLDPGHGGTAKGCSAVSQGKTIYEKNLTLSISRKLRTLLEEAGVNVIMTRNADTRLSEDTKTDLLRRAQMAGDNNANLFVSVHVDDCGTPNKASGSTAYYHMQDPASKYLAGCIIRRIAETSGLPSRGARSDRSLYPSGLAVLRHNSVPAVLVETAYINHWKDRSLLVTDAFQWKIARAIVDGIQDYLSGVPIAAESDFVTE